MLHRAVERLRRRARVTWSAPLIAALAALLLLAGHASAQQQLTVQVAGLTASDASSAQGVVSVLDSNGRPLAELTAQEFQAWINDVSVPITGVSRGIDSTQPINVALVVDVSGSTQQNGAFQLAKDAVHQFLNGLSEQDRVAIVTFDDAVGVVLPFTQDRAAAGAAIDGLHATDTTALYQATVYSARLAASSTIGRRAVVLLTDGVDNNSPATRDDAIAAAGALGVPIFTIGLGATIDRDYLTQIAKVSGGQFADTPTADGVAELYRSVGEVLRGQYILTLDSSAVNLVVGDVITLRVDATASDAVGSDSREVCLQPICVALTNLEQNERIKDARTIEARVVSAEPIVSVTFLVDGKPVVTASSPPYQFTLDPAPLAKGSHTLAAQATTAAGATQVREISLRTGPAGGGISSTMLLFPVGAIVIALVAFVALRLLRRRRPRDIDLAPANLGPSPKTPSPEPLAKPRKRLCVVDRDKAPLPPVLEEAVGRLLATAGPLAGQAFSVSNQPLSIGVGTRCPIRLPDEGLDPHDVKPEQARVWIRDGQLMVHELRRLTALGPAGGRWEILSPGDEFVVGTSTFTFELLGQPSKPEPAPAAPEVEPAKQPEERAHVLRAIMTPVLPETPLEELAPAPERQWAIRPEPPVVPAETAPPAEPAERPAFEHAPAPASEETAPVASLSLDPALSSLDEANAEAEAEGLWNSPIPFRRPPERPAVIAGPFADAGDSRPDILRDGTRQPEAQALEELPPEGNVPNILRDHPAGAQAGPFGDAVSTAPQSDAVPNILRDRSNEPRAEARTDAAEAPGRSSKPSSNPDVTDPQSWTPL